MTLETPQVESNSADRAEAIRAEIHCLVEEYFALVHRPAAFKAGLSAVPVSGRVYDASDIKSLIDSALEFWLTTGRFNKAFEEALASKIGVRYALTVNSGSSANLVAMSALTSPLLRDRQLKAGDEVITAATGFPTTVNPALLWGLTPVFVDVSIPTYNIEPDLVEAAITPRTKAIMVAHTLGNPFDAPRIAAIAKRHGLFLIEDCCDALGATIGGRHVGTIGDIGTLSFYPAHHITMGEGGAAFSRNPTLRRAMEAFRDWGRDCYCDPGKDNTCGRRFDWQLGELPHGFDHKYIYSHLGFNLKITDMQAAVGLSQLTHLDTFIAARRRNFELLSQGLQEFEEYFLLPRATPDSNPSWFGFPITIKEESPFTRADLLDYLNEKKIGTRLLFGGNLTRQPYMVGRNFRVHGSLENSDRVMRHTFWIGLYPALQQEHIEYVCEVFRAFCRGKR